MKRRLSVTDSLIYTAQEVLHRLSWVVVAQMSYLPAFFWPQKLGATNEIAVGLSYIAQKLLVLNEEKVICYQLELGKYNLPTFRLNVLVVIRAKDIWATTTRLSLTEPFSTSCAVYIRELVDSLCRNGADAQYMQYLSKSGITSPQIR